MSAGWVAEARFSLTREIIFSLLEALWVYLCAEFEQMYGCNGLLWR